MANYRIIADSAFKPFSYADLIAPVHASTEAHQQLEEAYGELSSQAELLGNKADEQRDPYSYALFNRYAQDLENQAASLAREGLTTSSKRRLLSMRSRYNSDIAPIDEAYKKREILAAEQRQKMIQDPTAMFERRAGDISIDELVMNPSADYGRAHSGNLLMQQTQSIISNLAKEHSYYGLGNPIDKYTNTFIQKLGFSRDQILDAITNPDAEHSQPVLNKVRETVMDMSGIKSWNSDAAIKQAYQYINAGLWSAIGQTSVQHIENYGNRAALQHAYDLAKINHQNSLNNPPKKPKAPPYFEWLSKKESDELTKQIKNFEKKGYIDPKTGDYTELGKRALVLKYTPYQVKDPITGVDTEYEMITGGDPVWIEFHKKYIVENPEGAATAAKLIRGLYGGGDDSELDDNTRTFLNNIIENDLENQELIKAMWGRAHLDMSQGTMGVQAFNIPLGDKDGSIYALNRLTSQGIDGLYVAGIAKIKNGYSYIPDGDNRVSIDDIKDGINNKDKGLVIEQIINLPQSDQLAFLLSDGRKLMVPIEGLSSSAQANLRQQNYFSRGFDAAGQTELRDDALNNGLQIIRDDLLQKNDPLNVNTLSNLQQ